MNYIEKFPEKALCRNRSSNLKSKKGFNNHHWSYNLEHAKDVIEITSKNHAKIHRYMIYDQDWFMYRNTINTKSFEAMELMDTRERHERYIEEILIIKKDD